MAYEWIVDALDATWSETQRTLVGRSEETFDLATPCPGWSIRDVLSHLIGFELMIQGETVPRYEGEQPSYVRNPIGEVNEAYVQKFRSSTGRELLDLFHETTQKSLGTLRLLEDAAWEKIGWSPEGERPYHRFQETRVLDSWIHLQDIRDALLEPQDDHGVGEEIVLNRFEAALPYVLAKRARAASGTRVLVRLVGRYGRTVSLGVDDGRASASVYADTYDLELTTPTALFWRRCAGRISAEAFLRASSTEVHGDQQLAVALAGGLAIMI